MKLSGMADANCCFKLFGVRAYGREIDSSVFSNSNFVKAFSSGDLHVPSMRNIPGTSTNMSFYFVGEEAFP